MKSHPAKYNLTNCKTVVKTTMYPAAQLEIPASRGENGFRTVTVSQQKISPSKRARVILAISLCVCLSSDLPAQSPAFPPFGQSRSTQGNSQPGEQFSQSRPCTPADYGDPTADCIPQSNQQAAYYNTNDFSEFGSYPGMSPGAGRLPSNGGSSEPYGSMRDTSSVTPPSYNQKEPPTEFQKYVATSVGQMLPIFGASLFEHVPATFAPIDRAPVSVDYAIAPGDGLQISVWGEVNFSRQAIVGRTGEIILPDAGPISVEGMNYSQAAA